MTLAAKPTTLYAASDIGRLLGWRPMQVMVILGVLALGVPAVRMIVQGMGHTQGALDIDTSGASGIIRNGLVTLDLPVSVYNGSQRAILGVDLWVEAFACPSAEAAQRDCTRLMSFEQSETMRVMPHGAAQTNASRVGGLPAYIAGEHLRITRKLTHIEDDQDALDKARDARFDKL